MAEPFQFRLIRSGGVFDGFRNVRVGPYVLSIQAGQEFASRPSVDGLLPEQYKSFEIGIPKVAHEWARAKWGEPETFAHEGRVAIYHDVPASEVQQLINWLIQQDAS